jgi:hypothetical protein
MDYPRHEIDREHVALSLPFEEKRLSSGLHVCATRPAALSLQLQTAARCAGYASVTDPGGDVICRALRQGARVGAALFELASGHGEVAVDLGELRARLPATGVTDSTHAGNWRSAIWQALIVRDAAAIASLCATDVSILRSSITKSDEHQYLFVAALQAFLREDAAASEMLRAARAAASAAEGPAIDPPHALAIAVPEMNLLRALASREAEPFNHALGAALTGHQAYWSQHGAREPLGYLAFGPLAFASLAWDAGIAIDLSSEYIPARLYQGQCAIRAT